MSEKMPVNGAPDAERPMTDDAKLADLFPRPAFRVVDSNGIVHTAESKTEVGELNQDQLEAA